MQSKHWTILTLFIIMDINRLIACDPVVITSYGPVRGFVAVDDSNCTIDVFLGIPFAQPPLNSLRFEKPITLNKTGWPGILNASQQPNNCVPHARPDWFNALLQQGNTSYSEDCLYLNIYAPHNTSKNAQLPVLVLIHGGGFEVGSSREYGNYKDFGAKFVSHGIIVVTIQYRLGVFGFASTGDSVLPGNLGLWDQSMALKFIVANIASFGGDPQKITLMGHSAGSSSVSALGLSPHSRDMFQRSIQMSGSAFSSVVYGSQLAQDTQKLAQQLGCSMDSSAAIKSCFQATTEDQFFDAVEQIGPAREEPNCVRFSPRFDGDFFPVDMPQLAVQAPKKPTLIGFTDLEALIFTMLIGLNSTVSHQMIPWAEFDSFDASRLNNYLRMHVATEERFGTNASAVQQAIFNSYTNGSMTENSTFYLHKYTEIISDLLFVQAIIKEIKAKSSNGWPLYMYVHGFANNAAFPPTVVIHESFHGNDHGYIFKGLHQFIYNEADEQMSAFMVESFHNFVLNGNPSTNVSFSLQWPQVVSANQLNQVRMVIPPVVLDQPGTDVLQRIHFWDQLGGQYPQFELVREIPQ